MVKTYYNNYNLLEKKLLIEKILKDHIKENDTKKNIIVADKKLTGLLVFITGSLYLIKNSNQSPI